MFTITLKEARESKGYSIEEIAVACGVSIEDIKHYERDTRKMPFNLARKLKRLLHINICQIHIGLESDYAPKIMPKTCPTCLKRA